MSVLLGLSLSLLTLRRGNVAVRTVAGITGAGLLARALAGHCAVKSAIAGRTTLREGMIDQ
jgi:putative copper export protein